MISEVAAADPLQSALDFVRGMPVRQATVDTSPAWYTFSINPPLTGLPVVIGDS
jgi:hypothetical protein